MPIDYGFFARSTEVTLNYGSLDKISITGALQPGT
jgi:hypothetical protein